MRDTAPEGTGEQLTRTLKEHGLTVRTLVSHHYDEYRIVVDVEGGAEIRIADEDGRIDRSTDEHGGWVAVYRPHGDRSDEGETCIYESEGMPPAFKQDTAALVAVVVQCAEAHRRVPV
ncbi:hypothetical protein P1P68_35475 [Streptomyces scabiei]|uniref:hypothetical protein n=1 Tax=Streptomyces scabiei TaxID=1930 RepID=UPI00299052BC|nr:hypothetical protein [Streptomyces scabiei]MDW8809958.1 hypothetical protein [Streptomyces scabiei]